MAEAGAPGRLDVKLLLTLSLLSAASPLAMDFYLASLPEVRHSLHTSIFGVQLTLTGFLLGIGFGQVLWGPVSDRFGRRRPLVVASLLAAVAAAVATVAPTIEILVGARLVQALGGAAGIVIARAIIADLLTGFAAVRAMTTMLTINALAPILAPMIGGSLAGHVSWRVILGIVLVVAVAQAAGAVLVVRETLPADRRRPRVDLRGLARLLGRGPFIGHALTVTFMFGLVMAYISASSFVFQDLIGVSGLVYGLTFGLNGLALMAGGWLSARLSRRRVHPARVVAVALPMAVLAAASVLLIAVTSIPPGFVEIPFFFAVLGHGFVNGNTNALALEQSRDAAGAGSAVVGGLMFGFGAVISPLTGALGLTSLVPVGVIMTSCGVAALTCFALVRRHLARHPHLEAAFGPG